MIAELGSTAMASATEDFVTAQIQQAEDRWKSELAKIKEDIERMKANQSSSEVWKQKRSPIDLYKEKFALRTKEANHEKPTIKLNDENFVEFKQQMTGWMKALHPIIKTVIENLEKPDNRTVDEAEIKEKLVEALRAQAEHKYNISICDPIEKQEQQVFEEEWYDTVTTKTWQVILHNTETTSQARKLSENALQSGLLGWMKLVNHYDPRQGIDMSAELARIVHPQEYFGKAKDIAHAKVLLNEYQQEVARYNAKYPREALNKDIEMMSIRMIMPEEINNKITGETFEDKWQLIKRINKIVEDSRTTRPGETTKAKGKGPLAIL